MSNLPNPALVTQRAAQRLPRAALWLLGAAYLLPGLFGRDPWRNADITAFGYMLGIAQGRTDWLAPKLGGVAAEGALLPYWIGAASIRLFADWVDPALAARLPFALLLGIVLALTWYTTFHLARTDAAQPLRFAFGGEAAPIDYARAIADGAALALIATLGLLQLGHETTPELGQLAAIASFIYGLAISPFHRVRAGVIVVLALTAFAASGAPSIAMALGIAGTLICWNSSYDPVRRMAWSVALGTLFAAGAASVLGAWGWRASPLAATLGHFDNLLRQIGWFTWPAWPLALWTVWRWRGHWRHRHILIPSACAGVVLASWLVVGGSDRTLMLALPAFAVLAAFALPTLQRSTAAAIDWFSVFFFSSFGVVIWVVYISMQTGVPAKPAANVAKLAPGYTPAFSALALALAIAATAAWVWLVYWRAGRNRHPLWKSLVLPAGGVGLCWLLAMTLLLPPLNHARSYRSVAQRLSLQLPPGVCVAAPGLSRGEVAAFEYWGRLDVDAVTPAESTRCPYLVRTEGPHTVAPPPGRWHLLTRERRSRNNPDVTALYRRQPPGRR